MARIILHVNPHSPGLWTQYLKLLGSDGLPFVGTFGVYICDASGVLVAGVVATDTRGVYTIYDRWVLNGAYATPVLTKAFELIAELIAQQCAMTGKVGMLIGVPPGAGPILTRGDFREGQGLWWKEADPVPLMGVNEGRAVAPAAAAPAEVEAADELEDAEESEDDEPDPLVSGAGRAPVFGRRAAVRRV